MSGGPLASCRGSTQDRCRFRPSSAILGGRLRDNVWRIIGHKGKTALDILGSPDDLKFRSCLTLFAEAASDSSDRMLFKEALNQFYNGTPDRWTLELLHSKPKL